MGLRFVSLFALMLVVTDKNVYGLSESVMDKMKNYSLPLVMECAKDMDIPKEKLVEMKNSGSFHDKPCFLACTFRKKGVMDDDGMYSLEKAQELTKKITEGESPEDIKELEDLTLKCASVNDEPVNDGAKGCDRAELLHKCFHEEVSKA